MRIQLYSDIHLEFYQSKAATLRLLESFKTDCDVLVVAGDLSTLAGLEDAILWLCDNYKEVVYVVGNHEYYNHYPLEVHAELRYIDRPNFHWLHNTTVEIDGVVFAGTPLWFHFNPNSSHHIDLSRRLNDFRLIKTFESFVQDENEKANRFLKDVRADVIVTHHLPCNESIHPQWHGDPLNAFFCDPILNRGIEYPPKLWLHGHTHNAVDKNLDGVVVRCNPLGYPSENSQEFIPKLILEI